MTLFVLMVRFTADGEVREVKVPQHWEKYLSYSDASLTAYYMQRRADAAKYPAVYFVTPVLDI